MTIHDIPENDKKLFLDAMHDVIPLKNSKLKSDSSPAMASAQPHRSDPKPKRIKPTPSAHHFTPQTIDSYLSNYYTIIVDPETVLSYRHPDVARAQWHTFKSGHIPWQACLDLHHLNADTARDRIVNFLARELSENTRCILLIHGKGSLKGEAPVLKNLVNHWLRQIPLILAFHSAIPRHGGNGALYVLLKRTR